MPKLTTRHRSLFIACSFVGLVACGRLDMDEQAIDLTQPVAARCELLEGRRFVTVDPQTDCGPAPAGSQTTCHWHVTFSAVAPEHTAFAFQFSDVGDSGQVTCNGDAVIQADVAAGYTGTYDPNTDLLEWEGLPYEAAE